MGFTLEFCVSSISLEPFELFSLNFNLSETVSRAYADSRLRSQLKVKEFTLELCVCSISPYLYLNVPLIELVCRIHDSAMQSQGHTSWSWISAMGDMAVLQTAFLFKKGCQLHAKVCARITR